MRKTVVLLSLVSLSSGLLLRAEPPQIAVSVLEAPEQDHRASTVAHVVGGVPAKLRIAVEAPLLTRLTIKADLAQVARSLAAPLKADVPVAEALVFKDRTRQIVGVAINVPEVRRITRVLVRFKAQNAGSDKWQPAGQALLLVYPREEGGSLNKLFAAIEKEHGLRPAVFGESPRLRAFMRGEGVSFRDAGTATPTAFEKDLLYLAEAKADDLKDFPEGRVILFVDDPAVLQGVYVTPFATKVTLPLLDTIATNQQSRQTFIEILQQSLANLRPSP